MWLLFRLAILAAMILNRRIGTWFPRTPAGTIDGQPYLLALHRRYRRGSLRRGSIHRFVLGIELAVPVVFRFTAENRFDRLFVQWGLSDEFQTGDDRFDRQIYIGCDHPALLDHLRKDAALRQLIRRAMDLGYTRISGDGSFLRMERPAEAEPTQDDLRLLADLRARLQQVRKEAWFAADPFLRRVLAMETLIWTCAGYALGALMDPLVFDFHHVDPVHLGFLGLLASGALFLGLVGMACLLLRGSSQGHRVILESALVLGLSLPFAGPLLVSDVNRHLDDGPGIQVSRTITGMDTETRRRSGRRSGSVSTRYLITVDGPGDAPGVQLPLRVSVSRSLYQQASIGGQFVCTVHRGALGQPWFDTMQTR